MKILAILVAFSWTCYAQTVEESFLTPVEVSDQIVRAALTDNFFERYMKVDLDKSYKFCSLNDKADFISLKQNCNGNVVAYTIKYNLLIDSITFEVPTVRIGKGLDVITKKKSIERVVSPYKKLLRGEVAFDLRDVKVLIRKRGDNIKSFQFALYFEGSKLLWSLAKYAGVHKREIIIIDAKSGNILKEYMEVSDY